MNLIDIKILNTAIERTLNNELADYEITYTQATVIGYLKQNTGRDTYQKDIEYNLGLNHSTVSLLLGRMAEKRLVSIEASPEDRRYKKVELTPEAFAISDRVRIKIAEISDKLFSGISDEQQKEINTLIKKMIQNINSL